MIRTVLTVGAAVLAASLSAQSQPAPSTYPTDRVLTHREQATLVRGWIADRFDTVLPAIMRREGIDMWIIVSREYNDDPVFRSMAPLTTFSSRRRTILVFADRGEKGVERLSIGRFDYDRLFTVVPTANDEHWAGLRKAVEERNPKVIGVNTSDAWNHADGLTANEGDQLYYPDFFLCICRRFFGFPSPLGAVGTPEQAPMEVRYCSAFAMSGDRFSSGMRVI